MSLGIGPSLPAIHLYFQLHPRDSVPWGGLWPLKPTFSNLWADWKFWGVEAPCPLPLPSSSPALITELRWCINTPVPISLGRVTEEMFCPGSQSSQRDSRHCSGGSLLLRPLYLIDIFSSPVSLPHSLLGVSWIHLPCKLSSRFVLRPVSVGNPGCWRVLGGGQQTVAHGPNPACCLFL